MKYHNFITSEDAASKVAATYRMQGFAAYYLMLSFNNYQVRYWK
jgi:hypothetical protein